MIMYQKLVQILVTISKNVKDYGKDLAIISTGALAGMAVDTAIGNLWNAGNLPQIGVGTFNLEDLILLAIEGAGGYYLRKKGHKDSSNFVIGMFASTILLEVGEAVLSIVNQAVNAASVGQSRLVANTQTTRYVIA